MIAPRTAIGRGVTDRSRTATFDRAGERTLASLPVDHARAGGEAATPPDVAAKESFRLRILFALDVPGAGVPGAMLLIDPERAGDWLFAGRSIPDDGIAVLGCIWLALGALSAVGVFRPLTFSPLLLVQFVYKLIWLTAVAAPAVLAGRDVPRVLAGIFAFWVVAVGCCLPWRTLFARDGLEAAFLARRQVDSRRCLP